MSPGRKQGNARTFLPIGAGILGALALSGVYLGIVALAESPGHALSLFWEDKALVVPIMVGFGVQVGLFTLLKTGFTAASAPSAGATTVAGGGMSTVAMVACCVHHVTDVLPLFGLTAAAAFLAAWRIPFMVAGLLTNLVGIAVMLRAVVRERRRAMEAGSVMNPLLVLLLPVFLTPGLVACAPAAPVAGPGAFPALENAEGAVTVKITPLNLSAATASLDFRVVLDTHSVDLNMDLAQQAMLRSDTSDGVPASRWPIGNGHHYEGILTFPAAAPGGRRILDGARRLTLVIRDLGGVSERVFTWELAGPSAGAP
ncbi:MAG: hypothetical protein AAB289_17370 [Chloroflexota bacterium]